jgi:hypothetical protein
MATPIRHRIELYAMRELHLVFRVESPGLVRSLCCAFVFFYPDVSGPLYVLVVCKLEFFETFDEGFSGSR